jgi:hypothetical protein
MPRVCFTKSIKVAGVLVVSLSAILFSGCGEAGSKTPEDLCAKSAACDGASWPAEVMQLCVDSMALTQSQSPECYACMANELEIDSCLTTLSDSCQATCNAHK